MHISNCLSFSIPQIAKFMGPTWDPPGPVGPRWAPCWLHEPCYQGPFVQYLNRIHKCSVTITIQFTSHVARNHLIVYWCCQSWQIHKRSFTYNGLTCHHQYFTRELQMLNMYIIEYTCYSASSHYPNQCWIVINWNPRNKLRSNLNQHIALSIQKCFWQCRLQNLRQFSFRTQYLK